MGYCTGTGSMFIGFMIWILAWWGVGYLPTPWNGWSQWSLFGLLVVAFLSSCGIMLKGMWDDLVIINGKRYENFTSCDTADEADQCASYIRSKGHNAEFVSEDWEGKRGYRVYAKYLKGKPEVHPCHYYKHFGIDLCKGMKESDHVIARNARRDAMTSTAIQRLIKAVEDDEHCVHCGADLRPKHWWGGFRYKPYVYSAGGCFPVGPWCCSERWDDWIIFIDLIHKSKIIKSQLSSGHWDKDTKKFLFSGIRTKGEI